MTEDQIDQAGTIILDLLKIGASFYPPLAVAAPIISSFIKIEGAKLKTGLAAGTILPDGQGGFVPASNSPYDRKTGEFL
jgi:hypothetical protein